MALPSVRAVALAVGVPLAFAVTAMVLSAPSQAVSNPSAGDASTAAAGEADGSGIPYAGPTSVARRDPHVLAPDLPVVYRVATDDPVIFVTIDDGVTKDRAGLRLVEERQMPVTAFLTAWTIKDDADYFRRITRWGSIGNHSATHHSFADSSTNLNHEICYTQRMLKRTFGDRPWLLRPPYGAAPTRQEVQLTAERCGVFDIVMWNAVVDKGRLTRAGGELQAGDIVLLHFTPNLERDLRTVLREARRAGLTIADLSSYLSEDSAGQR